MIYRVDKKNNRVIPCAETDFKSNSILERQHIEQWIEFCPAILGEELLIVTTEYDKFDKTSERLDILALDTAGNLVVIELKRDDSGKNVDLQAVKYAAYCSTLLIVDVCQIYRAYRQKLGEKVSEDQAKERVLGFIQNAEFEELNDRPRIILVARQFRDEVTSSVVWLRNFDVDISCVKLSAYDMGNGEIALESTIVIPVPETREFMIKREEKDRSSLTVRQGEYLKFYEDLVTRLKLKIAGDYPVPQAKSLYKIPTRLGAIHFEWAFHGHPRSSFGVELHFERGDQESNMKMLSQLEDQMPRLEKALQEAVNVQKEWGGHWSRLYVERFEGELTPELKEWAVEKMAVLISTLGPILDKIV